ncbi:MAG: hypothetical protein L0Y39_06270 [Methylococcaceae bacterium]|nr:hypothetical protein [Methylococcaceae bacterium]
MENKDKVSQGSLTQNRCGSDIDHKRRSLAVGLTAPVLMTLASRPALAKQCSISAWNSGNLSNPVDTSTCGACTHEQWFKADSSVWENCGIQRSAMIGGIGGLFMIPFVKDGPITEEAATGTLEDALSYGVAISPALKYKSQNATFDKSEGDQILSDVFACAVAVYMNTNYEPTRYEYSDPDQTRIDIITAVDRAFELENSGKMNIDNLKRVESEVRGLMTDGSFCPL